MADGVTDGVTEPVDGDRPFLDQRAQHHFAFRSHDFGTTWQGYATGIAVLVIYLLMGILIYGNDDIGEGWDTIECIYFCMVTMSTVGYGDYSPTTSEMKAFTIFMILFGVIMVFSRVAGLVGGLTSPITGMGRALLERAFPVTVVDIDGDGSADYTVPRHPVLYYSKNMLPSGMLTICLQLISAGIFVAIEPTWNFGDAFYHCIVTATTVGYGDMSIETDGGRVWASFHILFSVAMLGELITTFDKLRGERQAQLARVAQLTRKLDPDLLKRLLERAVQLRPKVERDGEGLTELEYVLCMLLELNIVAWDQVRPFIKQFRHLDVDGSGRLGQDDLDLMNNLSAVELAELRKKVQAQSGKKMKVSDRMGPRVATPSPRKEKAASEGAATEAKAVSGEAATAANGEEFKV